MEVTRSNFDAAAASFEEHLLTCEFVAFDEEMTGIILDKTTQPAIGDSTGERFRKMKQVVGAFNVMQVGLCLFHRGDKGELIARPYNFILFPGSQSARSKIVMHASTAEFHTSNGLDFNKWIKEGVPFMSTAEYDKAIAAAAAEPAKPEPKERLQLTREDDQAFLARVFEGIKKWLALPADGSSAGEQSVAVGAEHELPECNPFLRRALYEELEARHPELVVETRAVVEDGVAHLRKKKIVLLQLSEEQRVARSEAQRSSRLEKVARDAGFHRVFTALVAAKKPLVGHNCLYDLLFLYDHLEEGDQMQTLM